jgi:hypothetical protein
MLPGNQMRKRLILIVKLKEKAVLHYLTLKYELKNDFK